MSTSGFGNSSWSGSSEWDSGSGVTERWGVGNDFAGAKDSQPSAGQEPQGQRRPFALRNPPYRVLVTGVLLATCAILVTRYLATRARSSSVPLHEDDWSGGIEGESWS